MPYIKEIFSQERGLFVKTTNGGAFMLNKDALKVNPNALLELKYAGRFLAKCILDNQSTGINLSSYLINRILNRDLYLSHIEEFDFEGYIQKQQLLAIEVPRNLYFCVEGEDGHVEDIIENGRFTMVTELNKQKYVRELTLFELRKNYGPLLEAFVRGFLDVIPFRCLKYFTESDIGILISGESRLDLGDMKINSLYQGGYSADSGEITILFEYLSQFDNN